MTTAGFEDRITEAIAGDDSLAMATSWVLVADGIDHDGNRITLTQTSPGLAQWAALGMHQWAAACYAPEPNWADEDE